MRSKASSHPLGRLRRDPHRKVKPAVGGVRARHHLGVLVEPAQSLAVGGVEVELQQAAAARKLGLDRGEERVGALPGQRGHGHRPRRPATLSKVGAMGAIELVDLVPDLDKPVSGVDDADLGEDRRNVARPGPRRRHARYRAHAR